MQHEFVTWEKIAKESWGTSSSLIYREERQVGKGTYGEVFLGSNLLTKDVVALKKVSLRHSDSKHRHRGLPLNALREIRLLKNKCSHPNVVKLLDVASFHSDSKNNNDNNEDIGGGAFIYMVFEYVEHDLAGILDTKHNFSIPAVKCLVKQLLEGLVYLHEQNICHRDLKCSNLLITKDHRLKLADFGLAREINFDPESRKRELTNNVITSWYRPPELFFGDTHYNLSVDMWSVGCILLEIVRCQPLFPGKDDIDQLKRIFSVCGFPSQTEWPGHLDLPNSKSLLTKLTNSGGVVTSSTSCSSISNVEEYCSTRQVDSQAAHLAARLLALDPTRRFTASQALQSKFFVDTPYPTTITPIEADSLHEWETKKKRKAEEAAATALLERQQQQLIPQLSSSSKEIINNNNGHPHKHDEKSEKKSEEKMERKKEEKSSSSSSKERGEDDYDRKRKKSKKDKRSSKKHKRDDDSSSNSSHEKKRRKRSHSPKRKHHKESKEHKRSKRSRSPSRRKS